MDILQSMNVDFIPENQTRTRHLMEKYPDGFHRRLGFDACCHCGDELRDIVTCPACKMCNYCSLDCRNSDATPTHDEPEDPAQGHSSLICMLLGTIQDDDLVEAGEGSKIDDEFRFRASEIRIQSELESYPETLANLIHEGPCFQQVIADVGHADKTLTIHVIGASEDAELWDASSPDKRHGMIQAYASSLELLTENKNVETIELVFVGPHCPSESIEETIPLYNSNSQGRFVFRTVQGLYDQNLLDQHAVQRPNVVAFFNPGFTVPDYHWSSTMASIPLGTPFLMTTNSEMEGHADIQYLLDLDKIQTLPRSLAQIFFGTSEEDDVDSDIQETSFFSENPFCGMRLRQSATMANDVYARNRWVLGAIMDSFDQSKIHDNSATKRSRTMNLGEVNTKSGNPALI